MKNLEMQEITGGFKWREFAKGVCEGAVFGASFIAMPVAASVGVWAGGIACGWI